MSDLHDKLKANRQKAMTDWGQLNHQVVGGEVFPMADHEKIELLKAEVVKLRKELDQAKLINKHACDDWSHDDTNVKELLKPHLPGDDLESDGYSFRDVVAVAELAASRFTTLENALREAKEALSKCANEETYHEYYRLTATKALKALSALNIK